MQASTLALRQATTVRALISPDDFDSVARTVLSNNAGMEAATAEQIVEEALKFVSTCARLRPLGLRPSRVVDEGWHALILHTYLYARLCDSLGRFVHHVPEPPDPARHSPSELQRTKNAISSAGYPVNRALWCVPADTTIKVAADCEHGPQPEGCSGSCLEPQPN